MFWVFDEKYETLSIFANPVHFVFVLGARNWDKVVKVQEPLPNHLIYTFQYSAFTTHSRSYNSITCAKMFLHGDMSLGH